MSTVSADPTATGSPHDSPAPGPGLWAVTRTILKPVASLQLTVWLFAASMVLVFFGTVAQKNAGIWTVVDQYFWSYVVWIDLQLAVQFGQIFFGISPATTVPGSFPFPGGKLIGGLMFANLLAAHLVRFKLSWKRAGVVLLHSGMVVLFVGEFVTREFQVEQNMRIAEGESTNYAVDTRNYELAFVDATQPGTDTVTVVPARMLRDAARTGEKVTHPDLPVDLAVLKYFANADIVAVDKAEGKENLATTGIGTSAVATERKEATGVENDEEDYPTAYVRLFRKGTEEAVGTYLVSKMLPKVQAVDVAGKTVGMTLRNTHIYKPYRMELVKFDFDQYIGTSKAKNYASHVRIVDPARGEREATISMNNPLRYAGEAFFQHQFNMTPAGKVTTLQVVRNPGWWLPYLSCGLVAFGMLLHFGLNLSSFLSKSAPKVPVTVAVSWKRVLAVLCGVGTPTARPANRVIQYGAIALAVLCLVAVMAPRSTEGKMDLSAAARLPVVKDGRVKPLDTVARVNLRLLSHREEYTDGSGSSQPAIKWYFDVLSGTVRNPGPAEKHKVFRIENDRLLELMGLTPREGYRYSLEELKGKFGPLETAAQNAEKRPAKERDLYEVKVIELHQHLGVFLQIMTGQDGLALPPEAGKEWRSPGRAYQQAVQSLEGEVQARRHALNLPDDPDRMTPDQKQQEAELIDWFRESVRAADPAAFAWQDVLLAYRSGDAARFNDAVAVFREKHTGAVSETDRRRVNFEAALNEAAPFYYCTFLYVFAFVLCVLGWVTTEAQPGTSEGFRRGAFGVLLLTLAVHTFSLFARMYLMDRPLVFVTNLYSSAVFIGWAAVVICLVLERLFPIGLGNAVAAALGFGTTIIAHNLAASGDTLEMMQAVLDTNFWLATHVTTVTLGYSATYIAGALGVAYILTGVFTPILNRAVAVTASGVAVRDKTLGKSIAQMIYGIVCLATLLSFVGTVLGGIWADQSWGRFWGWDPKENGAVLIVIWNALILHARWCGLVKDRGVAVLAVAGNTITTWSWFGTNQLGVGLHAYGFSNALAFGCMVTWVVHAGVIGVGLIPTRFWRSFAERTDAAAA